MLTRLSNSRLVLVTGKGGTGKSTCAAAIALVLAELGRRTLLCDFGGRQGGAAALGLPPVGHAPEGASGYRNMWLSAPDPRACLQEYLVEHLKVRRLVRLATETKALARLWDAAPSVNEIAMLSHLHGLLTKARGQEIDFDSIVVDMPATGHALSTLAVPRGVASMVRVGPLAERARAIDTLLKDERQTAICVVTLAEELPVQESQDLVEALRAELNLTPTLLLANALVAPGLSVEQQGLLDELSRDLEDGPAQPLLKVAAELRQRHRLQQGQLAVMDADIDLPRIEIPMSHHRGPKLVRHVAACLAAGGSECGDDPAAASGISGASRLI